MIYTFDDRGFESLRRSIVILCGTSITLALHPDLALAVPFLREGPDGRPYLLTSRGAAPVLLSVWAYLAVRFWSLLPTHERVEHIRWLDESKQLGEQIHALIEQVKSLTGASVDLTAEVKRFGDVHLPDREKCSLIRTKIEQLVNATNDARRHQKQERAAIVQALKRWNTGVTEVSQNTKATLKQAISASGVMADIWKNHPVDDVVEKISQHVDTIGAVKNNEAIAEVIETLRRASEADARTYPTNEDLSQLEESLAVFSELAAHLEDLDRGLGNFTARTGTVLQLISKLRHRDLTTSRRALWVFGRAVPVVGITAGALACVSVLGPQANPNMLGMGGFLLACFVLASLNHNLPLPSLPPEVQKDTDAD